MDIEQLTKHQIILLTLLVSFVTSIATGIVTVSLMDQAPAGVTRVVNQIVEHTVERVVPQNQGAAVATVTEKTVVVKDDDLAAQSIAMVQQGIIRIVAKGGDTLLARGILTSQDGRGLTDQSALAAADTKEFEAMLPGGERVALTIVSQSTTTPLAVVQVALSTTTNITPVALADVGKISLGQSVIRISGVGNDTVASGVVAMIPKTSDGTKPTVVQASISSATPGSIIITIFGEVVGITTAQSALKGSDFYSVPTLPAAPKAAAPTQKKEETTPATPSSS